MYLEIRLAYFIRMPPSNLKNTMNKNLKPIAALFLICVSTLAFSATEGTRVYLPPFYEAVMKMVPQGKLGEIIKKESIYTTIQGARAWRIAFISSDLAGRKTISTGLVVAPTGPAPIGGRPVVAWAHGTTGTAQNCGPSQLPNPAQPLNEYFLIGGNSGNDYGLPAVEQFIKDGYVIVATDYQGLGGGGKHQYMVSGTQARDAINSIRAAGAMKEVGAGKKALIYGWSQGGGTVLAAASSPDYIAQQGTVFDGIELVGFVALAPPDVSATIPAPPQDQASADKYIDGLMQAFSGDVMGFAHLSMTFWALPNGFSNLRLEDVFTPAGAKAINEIYTGKCVHTAVDTINYNFGSTYKTLLNAQPKNSLAWAKAIYESGVKKVKPVAPVTIYWGTKDTAVPPFMGKLYQEQMCKLGANVARTQLPGEQTHYTTPPVAQALFVPWVKDRFAGKPAPNGCAAIQ